MQKNIFVVGVLVLTLAAGGYYWFRTKTASPYVTAVVQRGSITQQVSASGNVATPTTINLQFQGAGKLSSVAVSVGDTVTAGEVVARLDTSVISAQLRQAQAAVDAQTAQLTSLEQGSRPEQVAVSQAQVASDESALAQTNQSIVNAIKSAYTMSDDAVHNKIDQFINNPRTTNPSLVFSSNNQQLVNTVVAERIAIENTLASWEADSSTLSTSSNLAAAAMEAQANLLIVTQLLSDANEVLNNAIPNGTVTQSSISGWIGSVATARASINTVTSALTAASTAQQSTTALLNKDQKSLDLVQASSTTSTIAAQKALVAQAEANLSALEAQQTQTTLVSPVAGTVSVENGDVGETVTPSTIVVSIIPTSKLQVNVNLSEDNVANVEVGNVVSIALDAFAGAQWQGTVAQIDPAQTIIGGAVYYKTKVLFTNPDTRIKAGMTANVLIQTGTATSTLIVPASAIQKSATSTTVHVLQNGKVDTRTVTTGLESQDGMIEVKTGLSDGELVILGNK